MTYVWKVQELVPGNGYAVFGKRHVLCTPDYDAANPHGSPGDVLALVVPLVDGTYFGLCQGTTRTFPSLEEAKAVIVALARLDGRAP